MRRNMVNNNVRLGITHLRSRYETDSGKRTDGDCTDTHHDDESMKQRDKEEAQFLLYGLIIITLAYIVDQMIRS